MTRTAFVAHPITEVSAPDRLWSALAALRRALVGNGWTVRPTIIAGDGQTQILDPATNSATFRSNVSGIENSDLLIVVAWPSSAPTSIWLEVGIALGANVPVLIADYGAALPFLIRLAKESSPDSTGIRVLDTSALAENAGGLAAMVTEVCDRFPPDQPRPAPEAPGACQDHPQ
jgi:hypothetical protein